MDVPLQGKQLIAVEYPGTVINTKGMMKQFGGEKQIYQTLSDSSKRMELCFRPGDPYSKPAYGDKVTTTSIVIEVVRRRKKRKENVAALSTKKGDTDFSDENYEAKLVGFVNTIYKFKALCDFQMLPVHYKENGEMESLLPKLVPKGLLPSSWLQEEAPLFVAPLLYSRFDCPQNVYNDGVKVPRKPVDVKTNPTLIGTTRRKRISYAVYKTFESQDMCNEPRKEALEMLNIYPQQLELKNKIIELYDERPIWSKTAIIAKLNCDRNRIRYALASVAYHFSNGPWRTLWVKFGYDPRKDRAAKIYQLMDFRIKPCVTIDNIDQTRTKAFDYYMLPAKAQKSVLKAPSINTDHLLPLQKETEDEKSKDHNVNTSSYILMAGQLPSTRQCYYQLCDIHIDEVQTLIHQNDGREQFCHEKDGWCEVGVLDKCREIIAKQIQAISLQSKDKD